MKKIFLDCGFHHGEGLKHFIRSLGIDNTWSVHCFEANPECFMLKRLMDEYDFIPGNHLTLINIVSHNKAVWIFDGNLKFSQENHYKSESGSPTDGQSIVDGWASRATDLTQTNDYAFESAITVECVDFSQFIQQFKDCEVYCKMDIEGAEFPVLRKIIRDGHASIFKKIWIEFHPDVPGESQATVSHLINELSQFTQVEQWD